MDFSLTDEQIDIQQAAKEFATGEFDPDAALEYDENQQFPSTLWKKACQLGFIGLHYPEEYGGQELGLLDNVLVIEAFCRQDSGIGMALALSDFGSEIILRNGDEKQKKGVLPSLAQGKGVMTLAFLEGGYSLSPLATTAEKTQGGYVINGSKSYVTLAGLADPMLVFCQTDPDNPQGQSLFLIHRESEGVDVTSMGGKVGMRMIPVDRVFFRDAKIPENSRVGKENEGAPQLDDFFDELRIECGAMGVGIAQGGLDKALDYARKREQFGKAIIHFDAIRNKIADIYMEIEMARLVTYRAAWSFDKGNRDSRAALLSKLVASKAAYRATYDALQIHGGFGYMKEGQIEHFYRDAKALELFSEPQQGQKDRLADLIAGKKARS